jgi:adenylate kinase
MKRVLVITGTPGVGKSSISRLLASRVKGVHVDLADLVRREGLNCGFDKQRETLIADERRVSERVRQVLEQSEGYVIIDGHFAVDLGNASCVSFVFVLRRDPDELRAVLRTRGFKEGKVAENVAAEVLDVCLVAALDIYGEQHICEVDVSGRTVGEVVSELVAIIEGQKDCRFGVVDWMTKLETAGRLDEFLARFNET